MWENDMNPPLDATLEHFGVKGMHWGVRKENSSSGSNSSRKATAKKVAAGALVVGGAAVATYMLAKHGSVPTSSFKGQRGPAQKLLNDLTSKTSTQTVGKAAVTSLNNHAWKTQVASLSKDIAEANASQDAWMRSIGLGKVVNNAS